MLGRPTAVMALCEPNDQYVGPCINEALLRSPVLLVNLTSYFLHFYSPFLDSNALPSLLPSAFPAALLLAPAFLTSHENAIYVACRQSKS